MSQSRIAPIGSFTALVTALSVSGLVSPAQNNSGVEPSAQTAPAELKPQTSLARVFKDIKVTDQHGKEFEPKDVLKGRPTLVIFGYNSCPRCGTIADSLAVIQQKLIAEKQEVNVVVVSVQPEVDSKDDKPEEYVVKYYQEGLRQYQSEELKKSDEDRVKQGKEAFTAAAQKTDEEKKADQSRRIFHIVFPPTPEQSKQLQGLISSELKAAGSNKMLITAKDPRQHSSFITLLDIDGEVVEAYRTLDSNQKAPEQYAAIVARDISNKVAGKQR